MYEFQPQLLEVANQALKQPYINLEAIPTPTGEMTEENFMSDNLPC